jgi:hypothetical protein
MLVLERFRKTIEIRPAILDSLGHPISRTWHLKKFTSSNNAENLTIFILVYYFFVFIPQQLLEFFINY